MERACVGGKNPIPVKAVDLNAEVAACHGEAQRAKTEERRGEELVRGACVHLCVKAWFL